MTHRLLDDQSDILALSHAVYRPRQALAAAIGASRRLLDALEWRRAELPHYRIGGDRWVDRKREVQIIFDAPPDSAILRAIIIDVDVLGYLRPRNRDWFR